jgi:hypothetical protein
VERISCVCHMDKTSVLADLRERFGRKILLSPADIAEEISQSEGAQAVARHREKFDIPLTPRGRNVYVSIYDLADWLCGETTVKTTPQTSTERVEVKSGRARATNRPSLGKLLLFLKAEIDFKLALYAALEAKSLAVGKKIDDKPIPWKRP